MDATGGAGRASVIAIRLTQVALAAMAVTAGGSKLAKARAMVNWFDAIRLGQWFRDVGRAIEISSPRVYGDSDSCGQEEWTRTNVFNATVARVECRTSASLTNGVCQGFSSAPTTRCERLTPSPRV